MSFAPEDDLSALYTELQQLLHSAESRPPAGTGLQERQLALACGRALVALLRRHVQPECMPTSALVVAPPVQPEQAVADDSVALEQSYFLLLER